MLRPEAEAPPAPRTATAYGFGKMIVAFSAKAALPFLPLREYSTFNSFTVPGAGSPPKAPL